ncbi:MAG: efflux RND transporter permease subunit [bacterium]
MAANRTRRLTRGPIAWMAGNSVAANLLMLTLIIGGIYVGLQIKQEVFPSISQDQVQITVAYSGASPEEVEKGIILSIEQAVQGLDGVDEVNSIAQEGIAIVTIDVVDGTDLKQFYSDVKSEVDAITGLPEDAEEPRVVIPTRRREVISYALYGNQSEAVLREKAEEIRDLLLQSPDISQVELDGVRNHEIHVEVSQENLRRYGLTLNQIALQIRNAAIDLPGGSIKTDGGEILIRMKESRDFAREYAKVAVVTDADGARLTLGDIAVISEGFTDSDAYATFNGSRAIMIDVYRIGYQKPIVVADAVKAVMSEIDAQLPQGINMALLNDRSKIFAQRAELLIRNGLFGLSLVFICLALFLEIRLAFWVSLGIPISIFGSFLLLPVVDFSINVMSMFAYIVTLGIVVDDAIVVGENIYYNRKEGKSYYEAAIIGAKDMAMPVTFAVLTNIAAFIPLLFVEGMMGRIFYSIPIVVITVFSISLVESLFILPNHLSHPQNLEPTGLYGIIYRGQQWFSNKFTRAVIRLYGPWLKFTLKVRYLVIAVGAATLIVTIGYVQSGRMGFELFPSVESDYAFVSVTLPVGTPSWKVSEVLEKLIAAAKRVVDENGGDRLSEGIYATVQDNQIKARIFLTPPDTRPLGTTEVTAKWRQMTGELSGLENISFEADRGGPGSGPGLTVELSHRNTDVLSQAAVDLAREISSFKRIKDVDDGSASGKQQFDFQMKPAGERLGFRALTVAQQIRHAYFGIEALSLQRGRNEVKVRVRLPEKERVSEYSFNNFMVRSDNGTEALLNEVVDIKRGRAFTTIKRRAGRRTLSVTANVTPRSAASMIQGSVQQDILPDLVRKYPGLTYSFEGRQAAMRDSVKSLMIGLGVALIGIYALLAIPFRSFIQPMIIMISIPFGFVGVVIGHLLLGYSLSVMSLFGFVALSGVVVNDSLILIDSVNKRTALGMSPFQAIHESGIYRFRPILLTTITTFCGLAPMIFETSRQAKFLIPMAVSLGFGILFSTFITLLLVPNLYLIIEDIKGLLHFGSKPAAIGESVAALKEVR